MKKIIILLITIVSISSCSSNDDDTVTADAIIGKWQFTSQKVNGVEDSTICDKKMTFDFSADNKIIITRYSRSSADVCDIPENINATWKNNGNSNYTITSGSNSINLVISGNTLAETTSDYVVIFTRI